MSGRLRLVAVLAVVAPLLAFRPAPADTSVSIFNFGFNPSTVTVLVGSTVHWTNTAANVHTVTSDDGHFDSGTVGQGNSFAFTFPSTGIFGYHCGFHAMTGTVRVVASVEPDLEVSSLTVTETAPTSRHIVAEVRNNGVTFAGASDFQVGYTYQSSLHVIAALRIPGLVPGAIHTEELDWDVFGKLGTFTVSATADSSGEVTEFAEDNNTRTTTTNVLIPGPAIDLLEPPLAPPASAPAVALPIDAKIAVVGSYYVPGNDSPKLPELAVAQGARLFMTNLDPLNGHTLISKIYDTNGFPIFTSPPGVPSRGTAEVTGVSALPIGTYGFYCTLHPGMEGTLVVEPPIGG